MSGGEERDDVHSCGKKIEVGHGGAFLEADETTRDDEILRDH
jgi:hypothetical protein